MAQSSKKSSPPGQRIQWSVPFLLLLAFGLGGGMMWLIMRGGAANSPSPEIENFLLPPTAQAPAASPTSAPAPGAPPNVSQMSPVDAARTLGNWNYDQQNWPHAIEHYEEAIKFGADNPDVRTDLGNCYRFLGQPEKALEQYQLAQKQNPQHENSLFNQISLFAQFLHDQDRAASAAREFVTKFPLSPQAQAARQQLQASPSAPSPKTP
ncbi:MAG: tetratricopeptide repeat protein [Chthoniobacterales bacterium]